MKRVLASAFVFGVVLLTASVALANAGPPRPQPVNPNMTVAAVAGGAGAALVGIWMIRRPKP